MKRDARLRQIDCIVLPCVALFEKLFAGIKHAKKMRKLHVDGVEL